MQVCDDRRKSRFGVSVKINVLNMKLECIQLLGY